MAMGAGTGVPVPLRAMLRTAGVALSETVRAAVKDAAETGVKVTEMAQEDRAASVAVQVVAAMEKSAGLAPVSRMLPMVSVALPGFERVTI